MNKTTLSIYFMLSLAIGLSVANSLTVLFFMGIILLPILIAINVTHQKMTEKNHINLNTWFLIIVGSFSYLLFPLLTCFKYIYPEMLTPLVLSVFIIPFLFIQLPAQEQRVPIRRIICFLLASNLFSFVVKILFTHHFPGSFIVQAILYTLAIMLGMGALILYTGYFISFIAGSRPRTFSNLLFDTYQKEQNEL